MPLLRVHLLGTPRIEYEDNALKFTHRKTIALLAYLLLNPGPHSREFLATLLWQESEPKRAYAYLRNAWWQLNQTAFADHLHADRETMELLPDDDVWLDVHHIENLLEHVRTHDHPETEVCALCAPVLSDIAGTYRGSFMEGFTLPDSTAYDDWQFQQAEHLREQMVRVLERLVQWHSNQAAYPQAIDYTRHWLALDSLNESAHRQLMRLYAWDGQRSSALRQYQACTKLLEEEVGAQPAEETTALYEAIRTRTFEAPSPEEPVNDEAVLETPAAPLPPPDAEKQVMPKPSPQIEGERRFITALIARIKRSASRPEYDDPETWGEVMLEVIPVLENEVQRFGGEVSQVRDDGLLVLFGLTTAHEDDPERAVLTALAMQEAFQRYTANQSGEIDLQVGISTGEVIATSIGNQHRTYAALGRVTELAEQMGEATEPGTVLVAEATYRLVEPLFIWKMVGRYQVQGVRGLLAVYQPLAHKGMQTKGRGIEGLTSVLVGRDEETQALQDAVERLKAGIGGIATVVGEAGIGKSRLVAEVKSIEQAAGITWLEGRCLSYATSAAYHLWIDLQRTWIGITAETQPEHMAETLRTTVRQVCADEYGDVYPFLARMLSFPLDEASGARLRGIEAGGLQMLTFRAVETLLTCISKENPLVLVCEDLHWVDPTSLALLERILPLIDQAPLLLVCVMRPETEHGCWHIKELAARDYRHRYTDLWLYPLNHAESGTLVGNLLHIEDLPVTLRTNILESAEGNPYFLEEMLRSLIEDEIIANNEFIDATSGLRVNRWVATREIDALSIPDTLHGVLTARIDRLEPEAKRVLQLASVIGRSFSYKVLAAIVQQLSTQALDSYLVILQRAELIREKARLPDREYIFKHVLTQEAAYSGLMKRQRNALHQQVAEILERLYPEHIEENLGLLAHHWEQAGDAKQAVKYLRRAGEQAAAQYANTEAVDYLSRALTLILDGDITTRYHLLVSREKVYDLLGRREFQENDLAILVKLAKTLDSNNPQAGKSRQAEIELRQIHLAIRTGNYQQALETVEKTVLVCQASQDVYAEAAAYREWGRSHFYRYELEEAILKVELALSLAQKAGLHQIEIDSLHTLGAIYLLLDPIKAQVYFEQELVMCRKINSRRSEGEALRDISYALRALGYHTQSMSYAKQSLQICRETGNRRDEGFALIRIGETHLQLHKHDYGTVDDYAHQAIDIFRETRDINGQILAYNLFVAVAECQENSAQILHYYQQELQDLQKVGHQQYMSEVLQKVGSFQIHHHQFTDAQRNLEQALYLSRKAQIRYWNSSILQDLGLLHLQLGNYTDAKMMLVESLSIAREVKIYVFECNCLFKLGFLAQKLGDSESAHRYGEQILAIAQEKGDINWQGLANLILGHALAGLGERDSAMAAYNQSIQITQQKNFSNESAKKESILECTAGITHLEFISGDRTSALALVEDIVQYLQEKPLLTYTWEPFRIYLTCYQTLEANDDPRAGDILNQAYTLLQERAATIEDEALHCSYLENVPENREIVALWGRAHKG